MVLSGLAGVDFGGEGSLSDPDPYCSIWVSECGIAGGMFICDPLDDSRAGCCSFKVSGVFSSSISLVCRTASSVVSAVISWFGSSSGGGMS